MRLAECTHKPGNRFQQLYSYFFNCVHSFLICLSQPIGAGECDRLIGYSVLARSKEKVAADQLIQFEQPELKSFRRRRVDARVCLQF